MQVPGVNLSTRSKNNNIQIPSSLKPEFLCVMQMLYFLQVIYHQVLVSQEQTERSPYKGENDAGWAAGSDTSSSCQFSVSFCKTSRTCKAPWWSFQRAGNGMEQAASWLSHWSEVLITALILLHAQQNRTSVETYNPVRRGKKISPMEISEIVF